MQAAHSISPLNGATETRLTMICKRCGKPMEEEKRSFHKKRKWVCKNCGNVVMQKPREGKSRG